MTIVYCETIAEFGYKRIETEKTYYIERPFRSGGLLYGYMDRYNVKSFEFDHIISIGGEYNPEFFRFKVLGMPGGAAGTGATGTGAGRAAGAA